MAYPATPAGTGGSLPPLSVGNVVSAAFRLYSSHLKRYLQLSLFANLLLIIPIYGWARYAAKQGTMSRLAYAELVNQPEGVETADQKTEPLKWSFLGILFRVGFTMMAAYVGLLLGGGMLFGLFLFLGFTVGGQSSPLTVVLGIIGGLLFILILLGGLTWVYSRLVIAEVPLAVEDGINGKKSIDRSWILTKASVFRIQAVVMVGFLITLPITFLGSIPQIFMLTTEPGSAAYFNFYTLSWITSVLANLFVMPFWQALKAVLYYDLRSRREGIDLKLRDR